MICILKPAESEPFCFQQDQNKKAIIRLNGEQMEQKEAHATKQIFYSDKIESKRIKKALEALKNG